MDGNINTVQEVNKENFAMFGELDIVLGMFNPKIFDIGKRYINILKTKYNSQELTRAVIAVFEEMNDKADVTWNTIALSLKKHSISDSACQYILGAYNRMMAYTDNELNDLKAVIKEMICKILLQSITGADMFATDIIKKIQELDMDDIEVNKDGSYEDFNFMDIDAKAVEESVMESLCKSSMDFLNNLAPMGAAYYDQMLVMIVAPPGCGKSLFLMQEAITLCSQGKKVIYTALGDLTKWHFMNRISSMLLRKDMSDVAKNGSYYFEVVKAQFPWLANLDIQTIQPAKFTFDDYVTMLKRRGFYDHDVFMIDYDTNFLSESEMYEKAEESYNKAKQLVSRPGKIGFIASQPKQYSWSETSIGLADAAESSRKQQIVDLMLTISKEQGTGIVNHIGIMNVAKYRGGRLGQCFYFKDVDGRLVEIEADTYSALKIESQPRSLYAESSMSQKLGWNSAPAVEQVTEMNGQQVPTSNVVEAVVEQNPNIQLDANFNPAPGQTVTVNGTQWVTGNNGALVNPNMTVQPEPTVNTSELFTNPDNGVLVGGSNILAALSPETDGAIV